MSRIIVKNLPSKALEAEVRSHFESQGQITDVKVFRKRDGSSRRFAFIGFRTDEEAQKAVSYFNMSFMNSSRLDVSLAKSLGDQSLADRKLELKRKRELRENGDQHANQKQTKTVEKKDSKLSEFLSVMQSQGRTAMWKNDNTDKSAGPNRPNMQEDEDDSNVVDLKELEMRRKDLAEGHGHEDSDIEESSNVAGEVNGDADVQTGIDATTSGVAANEKTIDDEAEEEEWDPAANYDESKEENTEVSDLDWLKQRQTRIMENGDKPKPLKTETSDETGLAEETFAETEDSDKTPVEPTNRLFLRNLSYTATEPELKHIFTKFGTLNQVHLPIDPHTDKIKGIAFVEFDSAEEAQQALEELDGQSFQGRLLHIIYAAPQRGYQLDEFDIQQMPLKKQKALKRRMQASRQQFSWNSLYLNPNTVLEAAAKKLGITKSEMMDPASSNMAVQQALAESSVLESVQHYFRSKGVDLTKFSKISPSNLSDNVILAKNLPFSTSAPEIQDMFAQFGEVACTLMPPDGGVAIIQFKLDSAGRQAFKKLAFRRIGDSVLYLQKAPKGVLAEFESNKQVDGETSTTPQAETKVLSKTAADVLLPGTAQVDQNSHEPEIRTSVFVKNLNFSTTADAFTRLFQQIPGFITATIKTKPDPQKPDAKLSMGFGFVEFRTKSQADVAVKSLQNHTLDGHSLELKISSRGQESGEGSKKSKASATSKIIIKNIPFETTKQDVVELFGTFGQLRSVRVPRKFNRQTRGFAFAEFATPKEAENAMSSLQGAHLLGRRLVMDYAQADAEDPEAEIQRMESKVAQQLQTQEVHGRRLGGQQKGFDMDEE